MSIDEKLKLICKDNQYLLEEIEVKQIIEAWKEHVKKLEHIPSLINTYIDNLDKIKIK